MKRIGTEMIKVMNIRGCEYNLRRDFGDMEELTASVKANGVLEDIGVVWKDDSYMVIMGNRRFEAARRAGLTELSCIVYECEEGDDIQAMLIENMQRSNLKLTEEVKGFQYMLDLGKSVEDISKSSGFSATTVRKRAKIAKLDQDAVDSAMDRGANLFDFDELAKIENIETRNSLLKDMGTNSFKWKVKSAIDAEFGAKCFDYIEGIYQGNGFDKFDAPLIYKNGAYVRQEDKDNEDATKYMSINRTCIWSFSNLKSVEEITLEMPENCTGVAYYRSDSEIVLYKTFDAYEAEKSEEVRTNDALKAASEEAITLADVITTRAYSLRLGFITNFKAYKSKMHIFHKYIPLFSAACMFSYFNDLHVFEAMTEKERYEGEADIDYVRRCMEEENTERMFALYFYAKVETKFHSYCSRKWNTDLKVSTIIYDKSNSLDLIYEFLHELGYKESEEETAWRNGTHEIYSNNWLLDFVPMAGEDELTEEEKSAE